VVDDLEPPVPATALLTEEQRASIDRMLQESGRARDHVLTVESLWQRPNVLRVGTKDRSAVVKLVRVLHDGKRDRGTLQSEGAGLALCNPMPTAVAPRLIGFDSQLDIVVMEDLPPGRALADLLLLGDALSVTNAFSLFAVALAELHSYTATREHEYLTISADLRAPKLRRAWLVRAQEQRGAFLDAVGALVPTDGLEEDITAALEHLEVSPYRGLLHGDLCPDNIRVTDDGVRIFDFEASTFGPVALDIGYLLAPFPSCWCFGELPDSIATNALDTYVRELARRGIDLGDDFRVDIAAALACYLVAWLGQLPEALKADDAWGTSTFRPRVLRWLTSFERHTSPTATFPRLCTTMRALFDVLTDRWPDTATPHFPALATSEIAMEIPSFWRPGP
jgi:hypothetical protein